MINHPAVNQARIARLSLPRWLALLVLLGAAHGVWAEEKPAPDAAAAKLAAEVKDAKESGKAEEKKTDERKAEEPPRESHGTVTLAGREIAYTARTGMLPLLKDDGSGEQARIFYVYYAAVNARTQLLAAAEPAKRPITFCFNGGPGSSSVWLHFGGLGPRRVALDPQGLQAAPRTAIVANSNSVLDATDLVFIDPVGTGASRAAKGEKNETFWSVNGDIESVGEFIRAFTTREQRWESPKFLCGESYGGIRGAGLCDYLQTAHGLYLDGFISISGVFNFENLDGEFAGALCSLPSYAAIAHYHGKLPPDLQADRARAVAEAREFARGEYALALLKGATLAPAERTRIATRLARLTGLERDLIERAHLQVSPQLFAKNLLRKEGRVLGRYDARVTTEDYEQLHPWTERDPSYSNILGSFAAAANASIRKDLGYEWNLPYRIIGKVRWSYSDYEGTSVNLEHRLANAMKNNTRLRVLCCASYCDLAVPLEAMQLSLDHLQIPDSLRTNLQLQVYDSGHMMYLNQPDAEKLRRDIAGFVTGK